MVRWFKHMTDASFNRKITAVEDELGLLGSGMFWRIMEVVGAQLDEKRRTFVEHSDKTWGNFCRISAKKFTKYAEILKKNGLILIKKNQNSTIVDIPNILEYMDEHTRRRIRDSGVTLESLLSNSGPETDTDTEEDTEKDPPISPQGDGGPDDGSRKKDVPEFERFWEAYPSHCPRKNAKGAAERKFQALRKTGRLPPIDEILSTLAKQARSPSWTKNGGEFIPAPLTWLNQERWRDGAIEQSFPPPGNSLPRVEDVVSPNLTPEEQKAVKIAWEEAKKRVFKKIE